MFDIKHKSLYASYNLVCQCAVRIKSFKFLKCYFIHSSW